MDNTQGINVYHPHKVMINRLCIIESNHKVGAYLSGQQHSGFVHNSPPGVTSQMR